MEREREPSAARQTTSHQKFLRARVTPSRSISGLLVLSCTQCSSASRPSKHPMSRRHTAASGTTSTAFQTLYVFLILRRASSRTSCERTQGAAQHWMISQHHRGFRPQVCRPPNLRQSLIIALGHNTTAAQPGVRRQNVASTSLASTHLQRVTRCRRGLRVSCPRPVVQTIHLMRPHRTCGRRVPLLAFNRRRVLLRHRRPHLFGRARRVSDDLPLH